MIRKIWKCQCGRMANYDWKEAVRYITMQKTCGNCGNEMHIVVYPIIRG